MTNILTPLALVAFFNNLFFFTESPLDRFAVSFKKARFIEQFSKAVLKVFVEEAIYKRVKTTVQVGKVFKYCEESGRYDERFECVQETQETDGSVAQQKDSEDYQDDFGGFELYEVDGEKSKYLSACLWLSLITFRFLIKWLAMLLMLLLWLTLVLLMVQLGGYGICQRSWWLAFKPFNFSTLTNSHTPDLVVQENHDDTREEEVYRIQRSDEV